ncbi:AAEL005441-PA, partial [Aedes aegypti]
STDEDARQAMMMNGGKIKEVQVTLLLSSRAEMQKVIEDARRTTMSFMQLSAQAAPAIPQQAPVIPKVSAPAVSGAQPQPPVISLSGFLAQNLSQQKNQSLYSEIPGLGSRRSRSSSRERDRRRSSRDRSRSRSRDRGSRRRGRDRSRSRDRRSRSRSRDRRDRRRRSPTPNVLQPTTFTSPWDAPIQQSLMKLANPDMEKPVQQNAIPSIMSPTQSTSEDGFGDRNDQGLKSVPAVQNPIVSYRMNVMPAVNYGSFQSSKPLSNEQLSKLQQLQSRRDSKIFQGPPNMGGNRQGGHFSDGESNTFAKNNNRERSDGHDDVRRFFHGQTISSNGIKMINDKNGRRTGVAMIRFLRKDGKRYALSRDGMRLRHSVVKIESITDQEFEEAVDSYRPGYEEVPNNWKEVSPDRKENKREEVIEIRDDEQDVKQGSVVVWSLPSMTTELDLMRIFSDFTVVEVLIIKNYKNPKQLDGYVKFHRVQDAVRACDSTHKHYVRNKRVFVKQCSDIEYDAAKNEYEAPHEPEPVTVDLDDSEQQLRQQQQPQSMPQLNLGFGGDMNRDPRRRNNRFDQQQQQQMDNNQGRPFGSNRYDQQMGFNQGPPMGCNRFDQPMGHNQDGPPMGNNRYQQQQQMSNAPGGQFGNNQFNRNNNGRQNANDDKTTFIMITNLEYAMQESNIFEFFDQEGFSPKHVHILRNKNGRSMGECLVEFQSSQEAEETLSKHGQVIGKRRAFIKHLNRNQIMDIMQHPQEDFESHEDQETHGDQDNYSKDNAEPTEVEKMPEKQSDDVTESDQHNENPEEDHDKVELEPVEHGNQNGLEPQQQEQQQEQQQQPQQEEQQSQHQENEETEHTDQEHHESDNMHDENQPEPIRGNILCLGNLPFRAPNEELVGYFREYNITIEDVKRRYLPDGRPTGDAMVRFQSGMDAQRAMQTHYNRRIGGRQVRMRILED